MSWSQIRGHEKLVDAFRHVLAKKRLAHAYLFVGPAGIGKQKFARELAKAMLCERPAPDHPLDACGQCEACLLVDAGTHPDLMTVQRPEDKNEFPIDVMQEFCHGFALKPARGERKIGIVNDAEDLNEESANCFLKTLEEPPPGSLFFLIARSLDSQWATIRSRCHAVRFSPLANDAVRAIVAQTEIDPALLDRVVHLAAGSPGQAMDLADPALWECRRRVLEGLTQPRIAVQELVRGFVEFCEDAGKETSLHRRRASLVMRLLMESFTDALNLSFGGAAKSTDSIDSALLHALLRRASADKILAMLDRCLETEIQLDRYIQLSLVLDGLFDALSQLLEAQGPLPLKLGGAL
jgi:DNA polymerase-3 subunit delta'